jgi:hypothetical protein
MVKAVRARAIVKSLICGWKVEGVTPEAMTYEEG